MDLPIRDDMQTILLELKEEIRKTIVFITHDLDEALCLGNHIAILRDGEVIQQGSGQDIVLNPIDDYIMRFVRHFNRGKVICVESFMDKSNLEASAVACKVQKGTFLEHAANMLLSQDEDMLIVIDKVGNPLSSLILQKIMAAMLYKDSSIRSL